jgi:hypothetical protein
LKWALRKCLEDLGLYPAPLVRSLERAAGQLLGVPVEEAGNPPPSLQESSSGS